MSPMDLTINVDLGKRCKKCRKPGAVNDTGLCMGCISKKIPKVRRCRLCGCTEARACPGGCYWFEPDLCSRCAGIL